MVIIADHRPGGGSAAERDAVPLQHWWADSHEDVEALQVTIDAAQHGLAVGDGARVASACQEMHDVGEVTLMARLPAPDPILTSSLRGAIEDAHAAAHLCLAAAAGTSSNYAAEFRSDLEQAERQLHTAQELVNELLTEA
jgi:hypothetical protein